MADDPERKTSMVNHTDEDAALAKLGYEPELKRSFGLIGMIGFSFSIVTSVRVS